MWFRVGIVGGKHVGFAATCPQLDVLKIIVFFNTHFFEPLDYRTNGDSTPAIVVPSRSLPPVECTFGMVGRGWTIAVPI